MVQDFYPFARQVTDVFSSWAEADCDRSAYWMNGMNLSAVFGARCLVAIRIIKKLFTTIEIGPRQRKLLIQFSSREDKYNARPCKKFIEKMSSFKKRASGTKMGH